MITIYVLPVKLQQAKETLTVNDSNIDSFQYPIQPTELTGLDHPVVFIELYNIYAPSGTLHLAACDVDIPFNGITYNKFPIQRGTIKSTVDNKVDTVELKLANVDQDFTLAVYQGLDFRGADVEILTIIYPDSLSDSSLYKLTYKGFIDSPTFDGKEFKVTLRSKMPNIEVPLRKCQLMCNAWFGDAEECGATKNTATGTCDSGTDQNTIVDADRNETTNYWKDGIVTIGYEYRRVISSSAGAIQVEYPFYYTISAGTSYSIEQGCDKRYTTCRDRFNNLINFSGFPAVPLEYRIVT